MVAMLLLAIASLHVDENEARLVKDTLVRHGATTVEAMPMTFIDNDGHVVTMHGDDFIAATSQQHLHSLNHTVENNFRTKILLGRMEPNCSQKSDKFLRRTVEFADGAHCWKPDPRHVQECIE